MKTHEFILLALDEMGGQVSGKTLFQKRVYFIGLLSQRLADFGYTPYYYGPYSDQVSNAIGEMRSVGFIQESYVNFGATNRGGFEVTRRDYQLTEDGKRIAEALRTQYAEESAQITNAWKKIEEAGDLDYMQLSIAAKMYHILDAKSVPLKDEEIVDIANNLGWQISSSDINRAKEFLVRLGLVKIIQ